MSLALIKAVRFILSILLLSQLAACAVISKKECLSGNWYRIGYMVGANGERELNDSLAKKERACAKHQVQLDHKQFMAGHQRGIDFFCDPYNAVQHGIDGRAKLMLEQVCPEKNHPGFSENFRAGFKLHQLNQDVYRVSSHAADLQNQRSNHYRRLRQIEERISDTDTSDAQRKAYRQQYKSIQYRVREISSQLRYVESDLYKLRNRSKQYQDYLELEFLDPLFEPASGLPSVED